MPGFNRTKGTVLDFNTERKAGPQANPAPLYDLDQPLGKLKVEESLVGNKFGPTGVKADSHPVRAVHS